MFPQAQLVLRASVPPPPLPPAFAFARDVADITITPAAGGALDVMATAATIPYIAISPSEPAQPPAANDGPPPATLPSPDGQVSPLENNDSECRLLGPFALLVQLALGALALLSLVYKRWRERPQRPIKIWFFDVSKQVFGSALLHVANVFMSMLTSGRFSIRMVHPPAGAMVRAEVLGGVVGSVLRVRGEAQDGYVPNPCSAYLLNLGIDVSSRPRCLWCLSGTSPLVKQAS